MFRSALALTLLAPIVAAETIVVDNTDTSNFSIVSGSWAPSVGNSGVSPFFGSDYLHNTNTPGGVAEWTLNVSSPSDVYTVSAQWASHPNRATNATFTVFHAGGTSQITVNQQQQGGEFISLGDFVAPTKVSLSDAGANGYVIADAVQAVQLGPPPPPYVENVTVSPGFGIDMWTVAATSLRLFQPHSASVCDSSEFFVSVFTDPADGIDKGFCIESVASPATVFEDARSQCLDRGKRLPEPVELKVACKLFTLTPHPSGPTEWSSNFPTVFERAEFGQNGTVIPTQSPTDCADSFWGWLSNENDFESNQYGFRCVR